MGSTVGRVALGAMTGGLSETKLGTRVSILEPYQNWLTRFAKPNYKLKKLYETLNSPSGAELKLFLKLLIKAVNDEKTMGVLSEKEKVELNPL